MTERRMVENAPAKIRLAIVMLLIGAFTFFASANTYEVVAKEDLPLSNVIKPIAITEDSTLNALYESQLGTPFAQGSFGIPKKIKLSETKQHIDITQAKRSQSGWLASSGLAQVFVMGSAQQKVFGNAVIYLRYETATTQYLGDVLNGDIINIVTTEGWQLGYQVRATGADPKALLDYGAADVSTIMVIMVSDKTSEIKSFEAVLTKVGTRL